MNDETSFFPFGSKVLRQLSVKEHKTGYKDNCLFL